MTVQYCGDSFCGPKKRNIDITCHDLGKEAGKWIMYDDDGKTCYCICSCMGEGTSVTTGDGGEIKVEKLKEGVSTVLAAGKSLNFTSRTVGTVTETSEGETQNTIYMEYTIGDKHIKRVVTMDHPFWVAPGKLVGAGVLYIGDKLLDQHGNNVPISKIQFGTYYGRFWDFATDMNKPDDKFSGHLILTEGVVTGDYAISIYENYPVSSDEMLFKGTDRHIIGSEGWIKENGYDPRDMPEGPVSFDDGIFVPASYHDVEIPENASAFLPKYQSLALELVAPKEPMSNQLILDMCEHLVQYVFEPHYPDINFQFNWYDETVNSFSWVDKLSGQQNVYLSGGLARIKGFEIQGVSMALAHEVGHIMGRPKLENGLTCEGQADWFAGSVVMRSIWFGEEYFTNTKAAINQLKKLYDYMWMDKDYEEPNDDELDEYGQPYPSNYCRIHTYKLAMTSPDAPECSLCDVEHDDDDDDDYYVADGFDQFDDEDEVMAKSPGARDRQRRKKRRAEMEEDEVMAKSPGARDRQRRKKRRAEMGEDEVMAKSPGARDRQRRKKRRAEVEEGEVDLTAKLTGARDRQRKKKNSSEIYEAFLMAKDSGGRDRQRRKKR